VSMEGVEETRRSQASAMELIGTQELKGKLDRGEDFKLVMALGEWEYEAKHIPRSLRVSTVDEALEVLDPDDEIVLYDSGPQCPASRIACRVLRHHGYRRVRRYVGGLEEWEKAGHALERGESGVAGG
jgi:rhodanese-related sulfurtransferase